MIRAVAESSASSWESRLAAAETRIEELAAGQAASVAANERLASVNERLRRVVEDSAARHEVELGAVRAERDRAVRRVEELELELAELRRRLSMDSTNSSVPPSKEPIGAREKRKAERRASSERVRSKETKPGGQPGHPGSGLSREAEPDRSLSADPPSECASCQADLSDAMVLADGWAQVWDLLEPVLEKVEWVLPRRRCACCRKVTTAAVAGVRHAAAGGVAYGPRLHGAAVLLASEANVPVERAATVIDALLGVPVSAGFVARANERLAGDLQAAGFDEAMKAALRGEPVLCGDESPVNVLRKDLDEATGAVLSGTPHLLVVRTPTPGLVWYAAISSRSSEAIDTTGVLTGWHGLFTRDDYAGWHQYDPTLAGVQLCCAHLIRSLRAVLTLAPKVQKWAGRLIDLLREAGHLVAAARAAGRNRLDQKTIDALRTRYDADVRIGELTNMSRPWTDEKNHPGLVLARRLAAKADQVWLFTTNFAIPWTNNPSEQAIRLPKRHQAVSGYWHTPATLAAYLRVRSYLVSARDHGLTAIDAIRLALAGTPWLPTPRTARPTHTLAA
ncbi:transposase [Frankia canadensis]|uniref:Transposase n=1 Tax=Frankia canadensis TaxID=1836972 RepID=A0A2I2KXM8_9ACTN|nr:IS66 family transposase [Frankia canadensis]SNQ50410.1 transposase [Frankia canadensis]SOU57700.1 transposase [Frankia canadensis]